MKRIEGLGEVQGASAALTDLNRMKIPVVIASGFPREVGDEILKKFAWSSYPSVFREDVAVFRPAPDAVLKGLDITGVPAARFLVVGDTPYDIQSAQSAGCHCASVATGAYTKEDLARYHPTYVLTSFADVPKLIR
jgi:phosphoglycolate phosphatase-like HAD superfamily hydrolase